MSAITSYARAMAVAAQVAQPIATVRHVHVADRPLVFVPLTLAGEANAPLAALVGDAEDVPRLLVVPQPRDRTQRFAFAAELADVVVGYLTSFCGAADEIKGQVCFRNAPQILVPNPAGVGFVKLFGRSTRFRSTTGPYAVAPNVPLLGRWLTWFAERAEHPGSANLLAMTEVLSMHWATGQSAIEDANLAAQLGWISPPPGRTGPQAARDAEDPLLWPPAGPTTDPVFDNEILAPAIRNYSGTEPGSPSQARAVERLRQALHSQLEPTWRLMWHGVARLRELTAGASVEGRWIDDRLRFTGFHEYLVDGGLPQARRDGAIAAARRLNRLERAQLAYDVARAFDDPLVMANHRAAGEAFLCTVTDVERERRVANANGNAVTRPLIVVRTADPALIAPGAEVRAVSRQQQKAVVVAVDPQPAGADVSLEIQSGMGRSKTPPPGTVPEIGETLIYTAVLADSIPSPKLPDAEDTPWTHGGPPQPYVPSDDDATEVWE
ncbi:hypothetical protein AB0B66_08320 [Catellatospora sp. NPDC049111]|uniref:hypothetical protein n=1 Tax=Catellatospora sp. NPDC049111 TaxID=3155271 RepID=UPI0033FF7290